ncbi:CocE/NonD family hydrolase [Marinobacter bohaiensis]|uniref:CocE/NonD family hydrolase n=1 Tax=Marinobacter bohaiensis TaxID=2201898 RepID=UPI000DAEC3EA|nr:CocE/NonD family hydrolase [Marinobacter bohaiensis]
MSIKHDFPYAVTETAHFTIPLSDGTKLAARLWRPDTEEPVPAILEYLPYRKRDGTAVRDALTHPYFAGHGYACLRVDMRGNGESDGLMADEYAEQEQKDGLEVIAWLAAQPWCSGQVGMMGISWGGFNSLQLAALRPEPLKAIITLCSTDDRFADDIHYKGGNLLNENLGWASTMLSFSAAVPDPQLVGDQWREMWKHRLNNMPLMAETWMSHPTRDDYWRHGSVCEDYRDIQAAVYCVGGWGDAYKNSIPRLMEHLPGPKKAMVGPWIHKYPHFALPEPSVGFLQEALRWWDYWLKDIDTGVMDEAPARFYLQDGLPPKAMHSERPGTWVETEAWPGEAVAAREYFLTESGLQSEASPLAAPQTMTTPLTAGTGQGEYCAIWFGPDLPTDQRRDDACALTFDSEAADDWLPILGQPEVNLRLSSPEDCGQLTVRLNDVGPDGKVAMVTYGVLNLALRNDRATYEPPVPGEPMDVTLKLDMVGYRLPPGHKLRVSVSSANFPLLWPARKRADLRLEAGLQRLSLPVFTGDAIDCPFEAAESAEPARLETLRAGAPRRTVREDVASGEVSVIIEDDLGAMRFLDHGLWVDQHCREIYTADPEDADKARAEIEWHYEAGRSEGDGQFHVTVKSYHWLTCDADNFYLKAEQKAFEERELVHHKTWERVIPRTAV